MKKLLLAGVSAAALAVGAALLRPRRLADAARAIDPILKRDDPDAVARSLLLYFVIPVWMAAGFTDWLCHRASDVEHTGGIKESLMHLAMLAEVGGPTLACLFLEVDTPLFAAMIAGFAAHEAIALWDVSYAIKVREVTAIEQHAHSFLELMPLMAMVLLAVRHWPKFAALFGAGRAAPDCRLRAKQEQLPPGYLAANLGAFAALGVLPYVEELGRSAVAARG
jgi:hypothetical protein